MRSKHVVLPLAIFFLWALNLRSQITTATIYGTVLDSSGAPIAGARVATTDELTGRAFSVQTGATGDFTLAFVPVGKYSITGEAAGFKIEKRSNIQLSAGQKLGLVIKLQVGAITESIEVKAETPLINTISGEQQSVMATGLEVSELPVSRRDWTGLLRLGTGVVQGGRQGIGLSMNGLPPTAFRLTVDGTDSEGDAETPSLSMFGNFNYVKGVSLEAIAEVGVTRGIMPAEIANTMSGNVNLITRSGTNEFHGSLFLNNQTENGNARNQFLTSKVPLVFNQFGGSLGGPIVRNKAFFFAVYEGYRESAFRALNGNVPSEEFRQQALAAVPSYKPYFDLFPLPTSPTAPGAVTGFFQGAGSMVARDNHVTARGDYSLTPANLITGRYTRGRPHRQTPRVQSGNPQTFEGANEAGTLTWFNSRTSWVSEFRLGYNRNEATRLDGIYALGVPGITCCLGFGTTGETVFKGGSTKSFEEIVGLRRGRHSLKFGGLFLRRLAGRENIEMPEIRYATRDDFLGNRPSLAQVTWGVDDFVVRNWQLGFFLQDDIKVRNNLTVNMGLRYDYLAVPSERDKRLFNRSAPLGFGPLRDPASIWDADYINFSPRLGFAWTIGSGAKTVVRGGAGYFHNPRPLFDNAVELIRNALDEPRRYVFNIQEIGAFNLRYPITNEATLPLVRSPNFPWSGDTIDTNFPMPYSIQWTLTVGHQLTSSVALETGYVGNRGLRINYVRWLNQVDRRSGTRPVEGFGSFRFTDGSDSSHYHSWQTSVRKRHSRGLLLNFHYTWSSTISYSSSDFQFGQTPQDVNNIRAEKGPAPTDVRHVIASDFLYELPFAGIGWSGRHARLLLGGFQIGGVLMARTGAPFNVTQGSALVDSRPDYVQGSPYFPGYRNTLQFLNPRAFAAVPVVAASGATERPGTLGRNALRSPGAWTVDLALSKRLQFSERLNLQIRADAFNAFNHTSLAGVSSDINAGNFGRVTSATARVVQFNARLTF